MEQNQRQVPDRGAQQQSSDSNTGKTEDSKSLIGTSFSASTNEFSTPVSKVNPTEVLDPTKTFTHRPAIQRDISPIPDNSVTSEGATPRHGRSGRQKTLTMEQIAVQEVRRLFMDAKQSGSSIDDLETNVVDLFRTKTVELNGRVAKAMGRVEQLEKHKCVNNEANLMVYRALVSEYQMMLEELTSGAYIHVGRLEEYGYSKHGNCNGGCKAATERDTLKAELDSMHEDYGKLFESYKKIRKIAEDQKLEYAALYDKYVEKVEECKKIQGKMSRLREDAQNKLEQASKDMADCLRERDESLVGLRLKVRQLEVDLKSSQRELEIKKNEAAELRDICNQLMTQVEPGSDVEQ